MIRFKYILRNYRRFLAPVISNRYGNMPLKGGMVASTVFIFLLHWLPCSSFHALVRKVGGDPALGLGSEEYRDPAHIHMCQGQIEASQFVGEKT